MRLQSLKSGSLAKESTCYCFQLANYASKDRIYDTLGHIKRILHCKKYALFANWLLHLWWSFLFHIECVDLCRKILILCMLILLGYKSLIQVNRNDILPFIGAKSLII